MKVRCINAKERGIPIVEGHEYTVQRSFTGAQGRTGDGPIPDMSETPGYELVEVPGYFRADRFEVLT